MSSMRNPADSSSFAVIGRTAVGRTTRPTLLATTSERAPREAQIRRLERLQEGRALALGVPPVVGQGLLRADFVFGRLASMSGMSRCAGR
jgi:hypothetical protein